MVATRFGTFGSSGLRCSIIVCVGTANPVRCRRSKPLRLDRLAIGSGDAVLGQTLCRPEMLIFENMTRRGPLSFLIEAISRCVAYFELGAVIV
jgi:hypothetical protein